MKEKKHNFSHSMRVRLSIDEGFRENPLYSIKAFTSEKEKGITMLELIEDNFNITKDDRDKSNKDKIEAVVLGNGVKWTRDERGNIISPFGKKKLEK